MQFFSVLSLLLRFFFSLKRSSLQFVFSFIILFCEKKTFKIINANRKNVHITTVGISFWLIKSELNQNQNGNENENDGKMFIVLKWRQKKVIHCDK